MKTAQEWIKEASIGSLGKKVVTGIPTSPSSPKSNINKGGLGLSKATTTTASKDIINASRVKGPSKSLNFVSSVKSAKPTKIKFQDTQVRF